MPCLPLDGTPTPVFPPYGAPMRIFTAARLLGAALILGTATASAQTSSVKSLVSASGDVFNDPHYATPVSAAYNGVAYLQIRNTANQFFACTGSLMEDGKTVLTAAHCLKGSIGTVN